MPWYNISALTEYYNGIGLTIGYSKTDLAVLKNNGIFTGNVSYTLSLGSQSVATIAHANTVMTISINEFAHMQPSIIKRDMRGEKEYNYMYFTQGGIKIQGCEYGSYSEQLTAPKDVQMLYDLVNNMPGFWYYDQQQIFHIIGGNVNTWVDIAEDYRQFDTDSFGFNGVLDPRKVYISDHDQL